jgi:hypothetical protein
VASFACPAITASVRMTEAFLPPAGVALIPARVRGVVVRPGQLGRGSVLPAVCRARAGRPFRTCLEGATASCSQVTRRLTLKVIGPSCPGGTGRPCRVATCTKGLSCYWIGSAVVIRVGRATGATPVAGGQSSLPLSRLDYTSCGASLPRLSQLRRLPDSSARLSLFRGFRGGFALS